MCLTELDFFYTCMVMFQFHNKTLLTSLLLLLLLLGFIPAVLKCCVTAIAILV